MKSKKISEWQRKINNGKRKQAEAIQREKEKVWDRLKDTSTSARSSERLTISDIKSLHGLDVEQELADILTEEINAARYR